MQNSNFTPSANKPAGAVDKSGNGGIIEAGKDETTESVMLTKETDNSIKEPTENQKLLMEKIDSGELPLTINPEKQSRHILPAGADSMPDGRSYVTVDAETRQDIVNRYAATGDVKYFPSNQKFVEFVRTDTILGIDGYSDQETNETFIIYSKTGTHLVPTKKGRGEK